MAVHRISDAAAGRLADDRLDRFERLRAAAVALDAALGACVEHGDPIPLSDNEPESLMHEMANLAAALEATGEADVMADVIAEAAL